MLAVDGPIVITRASRGLLVSIQRPSSRPAGRPPEPARNVTVGAGSTSVHDGTARLTTTAAVTTPRRRANLDGTGISTNARAASTAATGAATSRYWYPLVGQSSKKSTGTATQQASSPSRKPASRRSHHRPASTAASTAKPI